MLRNDMVYNQYLVVKRPQPLSGEITFVVVVCMAQFVSQADLGQVISILSVLGESFGIGNNMSQLSWFPAAYSLTGFGPAFLLPHRMAILASAFGPTEPSGFIFGSLISALAAKYQSWPWGFWFMAIEAICGIVAIFFVSRTPIPPKETTHSIWVRMDIAGCATGICGLILFNIALNITTGAQWQGPYSYILLVASLVLFGIFGYIERKATFPLIPFSALTPGIVFVLATLSCGWAAFGISVFYGWQFIQNFRGISPLFGCLQFSPAAISGFVAAFTTGLILQNLPATDILYVTMPIKQSY
ncbi:hypothetical protein BDV09DRAFT_190389 [Aspergillus tetrazonus]